MGRIFKVVEVTCMRRWEKILAACSAAAVAAEAVLILFGAPIFFPYKIDWAVLAKKMLEAGMLPFH